MRTETSILADIEKTKETLLKLQEELNCISRKKSSNSADSYKKRKQFLEDCAPLWEEFLKEGTFVKVTGSRTTPYRKIVKINKGRTYSNQGKFYCGMVYGNLCTVNKKTGLIIKVETTEIIGCSTDKITHYFNQDEQRWVGAKELFEL